MSTARSCALGVPISAWHVGLEEDSAPELLTADDPRLLAVLDGLLPDRVLRCDQRCLDLTARLTDLETSTAIRSVDSLADGRLVGFTAGGVVVLFRSDGTQALGCSLPAERPPNTSWPDSTGRHWVALDDGSVVMIEESALDLSGPCLISRDDVATAADPIFHLTGPSEPSAPFELFALTDQRAFLRFDGERWAELGRLAGDGPSNPLDRRSSGGVLWLDPGRAVAYQHTNELLYFDGTQVESLETPPLLGSLRLLGGLRSQEHGILLSMESTGILGAPSIEGPWTTFFAYGKERMIKLLEFEGNLILGMRAQVEAYQPLRGICDSVATRNRRSTRLIAPFSGTSTLLVAGFEDDDPSGRSVLFIETKLACTE